MPEIKVTGQTPTPKEPTSNKGVYSPADIQKAVADGQKARRAAQETADFFAGFGSGTRDAMEKVAKAAKDAAKQIENAAKKAVADAKKAADDAARAQKQAANELAAANKKLFTAFGKTTADAMKQAMAANKADAEAQQKMFAGIGKTTTAAMKKAVAANKADAESAVKQKKAEESAAKAAQKAQDDLFASIGKKTVAAVEQAQKLNKQEEQAAKAEAKAKKQAAREQQKQFDDAFKQAGLRTKIAMKMAQRQNAADENAARSEEQARANEKAGRLRGYERLARTTALVAAGAHGDFEGVAAGVGGGIGGLFGGTVGAQIGEVVGEVAAKFIKAAIALPMLPGQLYNQYLGASAPWTSLQRSAADIGGAGGFNNEDLLSRIHNSDPDHLYSAFGWQKYYGVTQQEALDTLNNTGIATRGGGQGFSRLQDILAYRNTQAFRGMDSGTVEKLLGTGLSLGVTGGNEGRYIAQFGNVLQRGIPLDIDRSKLLGRMTDALDTMVKGGSQNISASDIAAMFSTMMNAGGPGRGGENAMSLMAGTQSALSNLAGSPATMLGYQQFANKHNNFQSNADIEAVVGKDAFAQMMSDPGNAAVIARVKEMGAKGNLALQSKFMQGLLSPKQYLDAIAQGNSGIGGALGDVMTAAETLNDPAMVTRYRAGGPGGPMPGIGRQKSVAGEPDHFVPNTEMQALAQKVASGAASDDETGKLLAAYGMPPEQIPIAIATARAKGQNPMWLAIQGRHETGFKSVKSAMNRNGTYDYGVDQINTVNLNGPDFHGDPYDLRFQNSKYFDVLAPDGKPNPYRLNPGKRADGDWFRDEAMLWGIGGNRPVDAEARANADQAITTGGKTEFEMLGGAMQKLTGAADDTTAALHRFSAALDATFHDNELAGGPLRIPPPSKDAQQRVVSKGANFEMTTAPPGLRPHGNMQ